MRQLWWVGTVMAAVLTSACGARSALEDEPPARTPDASPPDRDAGPDGAPPPLDAGPDGDPPPLDAGQATLTVSVVGAGTVQSDPSAIDCEPTCERLVPVGTMFALSTRPAPGWVFTGWSGDCSGGGPCALLVDGDRHATATFERCELSRRVITAAAGLPKFINRIGGIVVVGDQIGVLRFDLTEPVAVLHRFTTAGLHLDDTPLRGLRRPRLLASERGFLAVDVAEEGELTLVHVDVRGAESGRSTTGLPRISPHTDVLGLSFAAYANESSVVVAYRSATRPTGPSGTIRLARLTLDGDVALDVAVTRTEKAVWLGSVVSANGHAIGWSRRQLSLGRGDIGFASVDPMGRLRGEVRSAAVPLEGVGLLPPVLAPRSDGALVAWVDGGALFTTTANEGGVAPPMEHRLVTDRLAAIPGSAWSGHELALLTRLLPSTRRDPAFRVFRFDADGRLAPDPSTYDEAELEAVTWLSSGLATTGFAPALDVCCENALLILDTCRD